MALIKFEQDPTQPVGTGNFWDETGKAIYTTDVESAQRLTPSLASQVGAEATAAATAAVGAPAAPLAGAVASNPGATGSAATGQPAPYTPYAPPSAPGGAGAALVASTGAVAPPPSAAPAAAPVGGGGGANLVNKLGQLPIAQTSSSTQRIKGRDAGKVETEIAGLQAADKSMAATTRDVATRQDERNQEAARGEQAIAIGEQTQSYQSAQQERLKEEAIAAELKMLRGEADGVIDPDRFISGLSTGGKISMVILAGLSGAFGNMQGQGQNTFLSSIQKRIDEDIKSQVDQINSGRLRRNNLIASLQADGADARQAKIAHEARVYSSAANWARAKIKEQQLEGAALDQANLVVSQLEQTAAARDANLRQATEDKVSSTWNEIREQPKPVGGGMSELDLIKLSNELLDKQDARDIAAIIGKELSPDRVKELKAKVAEVGPGLTETSGAVDMTNTLAEALGAKMDQTTGDITWGKDLKGAGFVDTLGQSGVSSYTPPGLALSAAKKAGLVRTDFDKARAAQNALREFVTKNLTGATASPEQRATFAEMVGANLSNEAETRENLSNWARTLFALRNGQLARLTPEGQRLQAHNLKIARQGSGEPAPTPTGLVGGAK